MKDIDKVLIITFVCLIVLIYPVLKMFTTSHWDNEHDFEYLISGLIACIDGLVVVLTLKWYQKKHPEEFIKVKEA